MQKYRKKPIVIEAVQWTGTQASWEVVASFLSVPVHGTGVSDGVDNLKVEIYTLEGPIYASVGDWIIKGLKGEFYPCRRDIFEASYELVEDAA
jgi:hypothetical protein